MACDLVQLPRGGTAIVCSSGPRPRCDSCGRPAPYLCDWKVPEHRSGTCDAKICAICASNPAIEKHLCPEHARAFEQWKAERRPS